MDTILSEEDILLYGRIISKRQKIRKIKEANDKTLLALDNKIWQLNKQISNLGYVDLEKPILRGYKRYFVLREDIARSKQADFFQNILNKINTIEYSNSKVFNRKKSKNKKRKSVHDAKEQRLRNLDIDDFKKKKFSINEKSFFEERRRYYKYNRTYTKYYVFREPWRFVLKIEKRYYTKEKIRDNVLEQEVSELENHITRNNLQYKIDKLHNKCANYYRWYSLYDKYKSPFTGLSRNAIILKYYNEELINKI